MKKTFIRNLSVTAFAVAIIAVGTSSFTFADDISKKTPKSPDQHEKIVEVMQSGDYDAWVTLLSECGRKTTVLEKINKDNFPKFVEAFNLKQEGREKMQEAKAIYEELGIERVGRGGNKSNRGERRGNGEHNGEGRSQGERQGRAGRMGNR